MISATACSANSHQEGAAVYGMVTWQKCCHTLFMRVPGLSLPFRWTELPLTPCSVFLQRLSTRGFLPVSTVVSHPSASARRKQQPAGPKRLIISRLQVVENQISIRMEPLENRHLLHLLHHLHLRHHLPPTAPPQTPSSSSTSCTSSIIPHCQNTMMSPRALTLVPSPSPLMHLLSAPHRPLDKHSLKDLIGCRSPRGGWSYLDKTTVRLNPPVITKPSVALCCVASCCVMCPVSCHVVPCRDVLGCVVFFLCCVTLCHMVLHCVVPCHILLFHVVLCRAVLCHVVLGHVSCCAVSHCAVLRYVVC